MAAILKLQAMREARGLTAPRDHGSPPNDRVGTSSAATVLLFTGVRYERAPEPQQSRSRDVMVLAD